MHVNHTGRRTAVTLIELLVVVAIIGVMIGLLLPAIQAAREASRRAWCQHNLRQVGLAILNCEQATGRLPVGARAYTIPGLSGSSYGLSWWVEVFPYLEQSTAASRLDKDSIHHGMALLNAQNAQAADGLEVDVMFCPSSPLSRLVYVGNARIGMPSYVGISGAANGAQFTETRVNACRPDGEISGGGVLVPNAAISLQAITDGTAYTLAVGEASDYAYTEGKPIRIDGGNALGWLAGTKSRGTPPDYTGATFAYNITTIQYPPNETRYELPGIFTDHGPNNPLLSAHPGGVNVSVVAGSVTFLPNEIDVKVLKQLATRDESGLTPLGE